MTISQQTVNQLQSYVQSGNAAGYYSTLAANGHDYVIQRLDRGIQDLIFSSNH